MFLPSLRRAAALGSASLIIVLSGCAEKPPENPLLGHVPADTPYLMSASKPLPEPVYNSMMAMSEVSAARAEADWARLSEQMKNAHAESGEPITEAQQQAMEGMRVMYALIAELQGKLSAAGMKELGFDREAKSVLYGLGPFPVLRTEISDPAKVEAFLARVEQRSEAQAPKVSLDGQTYRRIALGDEMLMIVAVRQNELVAGLLPAAAEQALLPQVLGQQAPAKSIAGTDILPKLRERYGYPGHGEGYLDVRRLVTLLTGRGEGAAADAWRVLATEMPMPSSGCQVLADKLADGMPRIAVGMTEVSTEGYTLSGAYETSAAVGALLQKLAPAKSLPGMGLQDDALFSLGVDLNMPGLREGIKSLARYVAEQGAQCEWVDSDSILAGLPKLDFMLGPMLQGFSGVYVQVDSLQFDEQTMQPNAATGAMLVAVKDPQGIVSLAGMMNPALGALELPADGSPLSVPAELLPPPLQELHLARGDGVLALASGEGSAQRVTTMLAAKQSKQPVVMSVGYDIARAMAAMQNMMSMTADRLAEMGEQDQAEMIRAQTAEMQSLGEMIGRIDMTITPAADGLMMQQRVQLP